MFCIRRRKNICKTNNLQNYESKFQKTKNLGGIERQCQVRITNLEFLSRLLTQNCQQISAEIKVRHANDDKSLSHDDIYRPESICDAAMGGNARYIFGIFFPCLGAGAKSFSWGDNIINSAFPCSTALRTRFVTPQTINKRELFSY